VRFIYEVFDHGSAVAFRYRTFLLLVALALIEWVGSRVQHMCTVQTYHIMKVSTPS
jgi:hypothetical protein